MKKIGIWFTEGFSNLYNALTDLRNGDVEGRFTLVCSHSNPQFVAQAAADVYLVEPDTDNAADYLAFVEAAVREHNIRVIFPSRKQSLFNKHAQALRAMGVTVATVASTELLKTVDNKGRLYDQLSGLDIARIPAYQKARTAEGLDRAYSALKRAGYKVCVKPTRGVYGSGFRVLKESRATLADLLGEAPTIQLADLKHRLKSAKTGAELLVMQLLEGDERSVDCLAVEGRLIAAVTRRKSASSVAPQVIEDNEVVVGQVRALVRHLNLNGLFNVQFRDHNGQPYLLEINTRLSGRSYYATHAGVNLPYLGALVFSGVAQVDELKVPPVQDGLLLGNASHAVDLGVGAPAAGRTETRESF